MQTNDNKINTLAHFRAAIKSFIRIKIEQIH